MKAAVLREINVPMDIEEVDISLPIGREVLVRVAAVGLCHSDLHVFDGSYPNALPTILGHEVAGVVERIGPDASRVRVGDHVVLSLSFFCGHCEHCQGGNPQRCMTPEASRKPGEPPRVSKGGAVIDPFMRIGGFAEQALVHESGCIPINRDVPLDKACLIGCGVTTGYGAAVRTAGVRVGDRVAVIGCGGVGLSAINGAAIAGARQIIAIDRVPIKLAKALAFGATDVIDASQVDDVAAAVMALTGERGVDHALEAIGRADTIEIAFASLAKGGKATVIGVSPLGSVVNVVPNRLLREVSLQGSNMGSVRPGIDIPNCVDFYRSGRLKLDELVSRTRPLAEINEAVADMRAAQLARTVITFDA